MGPVPFIRREDSFFLISLLEMRNFFCPFLSLAVLHNVVKYRVSEQYRPYLLCKSE
jgi:hypothetical protein